MGDPESTKVRGPGLPGFAGSFAASSRRPGERDRAHVVSRLVVVMAVVALVAAGAIGIGMMSTMGGGSDDEHASRQAAASVRDTSKGNEAQADSVRPKTHESGKPGHESKSVPSGGGAGRLPAGGAAIPSGGSDNPPSSGKSGSDAGESASGSGQSGSAPTAAPQPKAKSQAQPGVTGRIVSFASSRCIDVLDGRSDSGAPLQIWDCSDDSWQKWTFYTDGTVRSQGKCMQTAGGSTANGAAVQLATCTGGAAQRFDLNERDDLVNTHADKCVDVQDKKTANGTRLQLYTCAGTPNQKWGLG
ncbi:ricin-type beta-trefoil lectin domain protein [Streptomyces sp. 2A115]|uniref:ricin-type beta-trefoil lectin domain protein n=1 Tax=Streptomyces sp. 2A115 TaxID=3457439 RepID=UPI003FD24F1F